METLLLTLDISHTFLYSVSIVNFEQVNVGWKEVQKTSWTSSDCFKTSCVQGVNSVLFRFWHQMLQDTEKSWNIWKHWLQHRFFPGKIAKFLRIYFFKDIFFLSHLQWLNLSHVKVFRKLLTQTKFKIHQSSNNIHIALELIRGFELKIHARSETDLNQLRTARWL